MAGMMRLWAAAALVLAGCGLAPAVAAQPAIQSAQPAAAVPVDSAAPDRVETLEQQLDDARRAQMKAEIATELLDSQRDWYAILFGILIGTFGILITGIILFLTIRFGREAVAEARKAVAGAISEEKTRLAGEVQRAEEASRKAESLVGEIAGRRDEAHALLAAMNPESPPTDPETVGKVASLAREAGDKPATARTADDYRALIMQAIEQENWTEAERQATAMIDLTKDGRPQDLAWALNSNGVAMERQGKLDEAIACFKEVIRRFSESDSPALQEQFARALVNKGVALEQQGKPDDEIACYEEVERRFRNSGSPAVQKQVAKARRYKAITLRRQAKPDDEG